MTIQGFVLTGGASRRMGRDKASLVVGGKTLAQHAVDTLRLVCGEVFTVGGAGGFSDAPHLRDMEPPFSVSGRAAMTGIYTALRSCKAEFAAILACDMPNVTADVFHVLLESIENGPCPDAAIPRDAGGNTQPLCAVLRRDRCLAAAEQLPRDRTPAVRDLLAGLKVSVIEFAEFSHLERAEQLFANLNTPEGLVRNR